MLKQDVEWRSHRDIEYGVSNQICHQGKEFRTGNSSADACCGSCPSTVQLLPLVCLV